ncbi:circularly permuted type 2 ATP-grasp protein [Paraburkholderia caballeronis]|uniref:circularly permuted type 2 ATP-grasp protein n=1 Tax=Paraburkholderia caballeronis TaxID=416943 RepID=UPI0010DD1012|nr:putative circularly permuted ATP-grasp superfamily protein [Paraburkholderia caballeronis]TDV14630.1 putative circularly permuted ATP-grasp superfamily protein [Paraburkholderia caballeronis]TDV23701.1 putative circularly permuted ATP-grasp superfamily protein [Paraburkholderia caballeronis]TDV34101.1 putative circularly permuted ATP-grasp superfamily protein [Paraburkholderia caballeronis]
MNLQSTLPFDIPALHAHVPPRLPVPEGHWDEMRDASGLPRESWRRFFDLLGDEGIAGLDVGLASVAQQVRDNDISYNVYADNGLPRAWALDLLPFLIDESEWAEIAHGVAQRARLLNAIVADIYGPQTLLQRGLLPPALVFGHPGYLRAVKGYLPFNGQFLQIVAIDLARAPGGEWTVISHRTEAPSGLGYALENRLIVASLFAEPFREMCVSRLAPSYSQLIATLAESARLTMRGGDGTDGDRRDSPHIALLTPGPYSETYFEHVFLARYLGLTLVEGKDLTVRGDKLYLKTLAGLERVHAVLRRLDDAFCDPVELRPDSTIGVPGLLQVMRAGNVMVANVPGAALAETPALHGFLPAISQSLLGEPLALPTVSTWWCGEKVARDEAFAQLDSAYLQPTWPGVQGSVAPGLEVGEQRLESWRERIERSPDSFTIQAPLPYSCAPRYDGGTIGARPSALRVYAFAGPDGSWSVMPGGFTRLAAERRSTVSMQLGGSSVDTWVLSSQPVPSFSLLPSPMKPGDLAKRRRTVVSSRAAENLFWAGRYGERAENNVRLCRLILGSLDGGDADGMFDTLVELAAHSGLIAPADKVARSSAKDFEAALLAGLGGATDAGATSIGQNLASQAYACGEIRGRLSTDHWRTVLAARNDFRDALDWIARVGKGGRYDRVALIDVLEALSTQLSAISGAQGDRMVRDEAWRLLFIGRHIERVSTMSMYLGVVIGEGRLASPAAFELLLQLFDSILTYRSLYPGRLEAPALLDLLVVDPANPRGLYGVFDRLRKKLGEIPAAAGVRRAPLSDLMPAIDTLPDLERLCTTDAAGGYPVLVEVCDQLGACVAAVSNEISVRHFSHANPYGAGGAQ